MPNKAKSTRRAAREERVAPATPEERVVPLNAGTQVAPDGRHEPAH
jgi:hypothetical protein